MTNLIFDSSNNLIMTGNIVPSSHEGAEYTVVLIDDYDSKYSYSLVDGDAVKGNLIPIDTAEVNRLEAEFVATQYSRDRKAKYDLLNQDEMRYDDTKNSTTTWVDAIDAIKAAHPKP